MASETLGQDQHVTIEPPAPEDRELAVLEEIAREGSDTQVAFQGLRRRLELHQQQLSRTLTRLERDGLVVGDGEGYRLTDTGFQVVARHGTPEPASCPDVPLAQALLPPEVGAREVGAHLQGRWFDGLRWYGRADGPGETTLIWTTEEDQATVRLRVAGSAFTVEVDCCREPGRETYRAVHALVSAVTELYGMVPRGQGNGHAASAWQAGPAA